MTKPTPAKKPQISQFRRALWHMNRTDLGWITKAVLNGLNGEERVKRRALLATLPQDQRFSQAARQLDAQGFVDVSSLISLPLAEEAAKVSDAKAARAVELSSK